MKYERNAIFTFISDSVEAEFPDAYITGKYVMKPSMFPAVYIHEIDRNRPIENTQLDFEDEQWESVYECQVVSAKPNTPMTEAYEVMEVAKKAFSDLYYREFSETNVDRGDTFTIIARFRRHIGGGDTMPTISA